jgi:hypothetical protein
MSLLYAVVFREPLPLQSPPHRGGCAATPAKSRPRSDWRNLLLHYHAEYLGGAKAPDEVFKDFKNHVLHVREKEWGGAIEAC